MRQGDGFGASSLRLKNAATRAESPDTPSWNATPGDGAAIVGDAVSLEA